MTLAINKYGIDVLVKDLLPSSVKKSEMGIFYTLITKFISLFRNPKINIKNDLVSNQQLSQAVIGIRKWQDRKELPYFDRDQSFFNNIAIVCQKTLKKYLKPSENLAGCRKILSDEIVKARELEKKTIERNQDWKSRKCPTYSDMSDNEDWDDAEDWDDDASSANESVEPIYANLLELNLGNGVGDSRSANVPEFTIALERTAGIKRSASVSGSTAIISERTGGIRRSTSMSGITAAMLAGSLIGVLGNGQNKDEMSDSHISEIPPFVPSR